MNRIFYKEANYGGYKDDNVCVSYSVHEVYKPCIIRQGNAVRGCLKENAFHLHKLLLNENDLPQTLIQIYITSKFNG